VFSFCLQKKHVWKGIPITRAAQQRHQADRNLGTASEQNCSHSMWKIVLVKEKTTKEIKAHGWLLYAVQKIEYYCCH